MDDEKQPEFLISKKVKEIKDSVYNGVYIETTFTITGYKKFPDEFNEKLTNLVSESLK